MYYTPALEDNMNVRGLALEANALSNVVSSIKKYFPDLLKGVDGVFTQFMALGDAKPESVDLSNVETKIVDRLKTVPYEEIDRLTIVVPEGFKGQYLPYFNALNEALSFRDAVTKPAMEDFYISVSSVLTNRNAKISLKDETRKYRELEKLRNDQNKVVTQYFRPNASDAQMQYQQLVEKNEDVQAVFVESKRLEKRLAEMNLSDMQNHVKRITSALQLLIDQATSGGAEHISPEVGKNLAIGAQEIAHQVEFFSINYFRAIALRNSVISFTQKLEGRLL